MVVVGLIVVIYLLAVLGLALKNRHKTKSLDDFFVGGRSFSLWYNVNTMAATAIGSGTTIGVAGLAYSDGISAGWILVGYAVGFCLIALLIAKPLHQMRSVTMTDVVGTRFGDSARGLASVLILVQYLGIAAAQVLALGVLTSSLFDVSLSASIIVMGVFMVLYTVVGGLFSISLVDVFQMVLIAFGVMVILPYVGLHRVGGAAGLSDALNSTHFDPWAMGPAALIGTLAWIIPQGFLSQELWIRVLAAKDPSTAKRSTLIASLGVYLPYMVSILVIGLCGAALLPNIAPDTVIPGLVSAYTPVIIQGVLYAALLAVLMSTATSVMLVAGSNLVKDVVLRLDRRPHSDRELLVASKAGVVVIGALSIVLALSANGIIDLMQNVATPYVGALCPIIVAVFFWKRATTRAAVATMVVSIVLSVILYATGWTIWDLHPIVLNLVACTATLIGLSLATPRDDAPSPARIQTASEKG